MTQHRPIRPSLPRSARAVIVGGGIVGCSARVSEEQGVRKRIVSFLLEDPEPMLWGGERIFRDGACVGYTTSGAYGHSVGGAVALGYVHHPEPVTPGFIKSGRYAIDVTGTQVPARASLAPPYDPQGKRIMT